MIEHMIEDCTCEGRRCTGCKELLCLGCYTKARNGLKSQCRVCQNAQNKEWREKNREYNQERHKRYNQEHSEEVSRREKEYKHKNRARIREVERKYWAEREEQKRAKDIRYRQQHQEQLRQRKRRERQEYPDRVRNRDQQRYWRDREKRLAQSGTLAAKLRRKKRYTLTAEEKRAKWREYYHTHLEYNKRRSAQWIKDHPRRHAARQAKRRAQKTMAGGAYTELEWIELCTKYDYCCLCCGKQEPLTADHIIPICKGGSSNIDNIQPLCRSCNSGKGRRIIDYRKTGP